MPSAAKKYIIESRCDLVKITDNKEVNFLIDLIDNQCISKLSEQEAIDIQNQVMYLKRLNFTNNDSIVVISDDEEPTVSTKIQNNDLKDTVNFLKHQLRIKGGNFYLNLINLIRFKILFLILLI